MQLFLCIVVGKHVLVFGDERVVRSLEVFYQMELMIFSCQKRNKVALYLSYVFSLVKLLTLETHKGSGQTCYCRMLNSIPKFRHLDNKLSV